MPISEAKTKDFWRSVQPKEYSIVKILEKTPAQISVWALLMSSQKHRHALLEDLNETHVLARTNSDNLAAMLSKVIRSHRLNFCDEEFPCEGVMHNKVLQVTINRKKKIVNSFLINDGSSLYIWPLSTLNQLNFYIGKICQNQVNVRAFDRGQRETFGSLNLGI